MGGNERFGDQQQSPWVPMNSDQVWIGDAARAFTGHDLAALVVSWLFTLAFLAVAIATASVVLYAFGGIAFALVAWWTFGKVRAAREDAAIQRYADSRPDTPGGPLPGG